MPTEKKPYMAMVKYTKLVRRSPIGAAYWAMIVHNRLRRHGGGTAPQPNRRICCKFSLMQQSYWFCTSTPRAEAESRHALTPGERTSWGMHRRRSVGRSVGRAATNQRTRARGRRVPLARSLARSAGSRPAITHDLPTYLWVFRPNSYRPPSSIPLPLFSWGTSAYQNRDYE